MVGGRVAGQEHLFAFGWYCLLERLLLRGLVDSRGHCEVVEDESTLRLLN